MPKRVGCVLTGLLFLIVGWTAAAVGQPLPAVRIANAESLSRAHRFIDYGDARFRHQEFSGAYQRYCKAAEAAPNLADAYFRKGLAQAALGRYESAVQAIERGLSLDRDWPQSDFRLEHLYGDNVAAKQAQLEQLATAAEKQAENADLMFLLGVELYLDRRPKQAATFLKRAAEIGTDERYLRPFLDSAERAIRPSDALAPDSGALPGVVVHSRQ